MWRTSPTLVIGGIVACLVVALALPGELAKGNVWAWILLLAIPLGLVVDARERGRKARSTGQSTGQERVTQAQDPSKPRN